MTLLEQEEQYFKIIYKGLREQGFNRCINEGGNCVYHGPDNTHCAVGWLLKDIAIPQKYETSAVSGMYENPDEALSEITTILNKVSVSFLREMQHIHDKTWSPTDMREKLEKYASSRGWVLE